MKENLIQAQKIFGCMSISKNHFYSKISISWLNLMRQLHKKLNKKFGFQEIKTI